MTKSTLNKARAFILSFYLAFDDLSAPQLSSNDIEVKIGIEGGPLNRIEPSGGLYYNTYNYDEDFNQSFQNKGPFARVILILPWKEFLNASGYDIEIAVTHSSGLLTNWTVLHSNIRCGFWSCTDNYLITTPAPPAPLKATYTITCESDPETVLYAPKGWELYLQETPDFISPLLTTATYYIPEFGSNKFEAYGLTSGQTYNLLVYNPAEPFAPVFMKSLQVNEGQNHEIVLSDGQCSALKKFLPGQ